MERIELLVSDDLHEAFGSRVRLGGTDSPAAAAEKLGQVDLTADFLRVPMGRRQTRDRAHRPATLRTYRPRHPA
jgi:hypothetical protein